MCGKNKSNRRGNELFDCRTLEGKRKTGREGVERDDVLGDGDEQEEYERDEEKEGEVEEASEGIRRKEEKSRRRSETGDRSPKSGDAG